MATLLVVYLVHPITPLLGQILHQNTVGTMTSAPGAPVVAMPYTRLSSTSRSR